MASLAREFRETVARKIARTGAGKCLSCSILSRLLDDTALELRELEAQLYVERKKTRQAEGLSRHFEKSNDELRGYLSEKQMAEEARLKAVPS